MNKKLVNSKWLISFIAVLLAALALCFLGFVSSNAVADEPEPEIPDVEPGHILVDVQNLDKSTITYKIGAGGEWIQLTKSTDLSAVDMGDEKVLFFQIKPKDGAIDKESTIVHDGNNFVTLKDQDYKDLEAGGFSLTFDTTSKKGQYAKLATFERRKVTVNFDEPSMAMLADNFTLILGHGDKNDVKVPKPGLTNSVLIDKGTTEKLNISFSIKNDKYFIPYITVNEKKYETVDTGRLDEGKYLIICSTLSGDDAKDDTFKIDLSIYAQPECNSRSQSMEIVQDATSYDYMIDGKVVNDGVFALSGTDKQTDPQVENAVATYDLKLTQDSEPATKINGGMDIHLLLKTSTYSEQDYKVVRNHDGVVEELDTTCEVVRDRETGEVKGIDVGFNSDKFSDFSVVPANAEPVVPIDPQATAQTGDDIPVALVLMVLVTSAFVVFRTIRKNHI